MRDVAGANLTALAWTADHEAGSFRAFNVGSGTVHTIGEMAEALAREAGGSAPVTTGEYRLGDVRHITASSDRLRTELGWEPRMTLRGGHARVRDGTAAERGRLSRRCPAAAAGP